MPYKHTLILLAACLFSLAARAQQPIKICSDSLSGKKGVVRIIADTQLINDIKPAQVGEDGPQMNGYRIQVYAGTERDDAQKLKNEIAINFDVRTYMIYESPYFKVRVGDYRSRMEAQQMLHNLKQKYTGILLVPELVNLPDLKQ